MEAKAKRRQRAYKIADKPYEKAMKLAKKYDTTVAQIVEKALIDFGSGDPRVWLIDPIKYYQVIDSKKK